MSDEERCYNGSCEGRHRCTRDAEGYWICGCGKKLGAGEYAGWRAPRPAWLDGRHLTRARLDKPEFDKARKVHDWRNYIPDDLQEMWGALTTGEKAIAHHFAEEKARDENWD